jgi:uncharacterized membrane protein YkvA (DUF1232 family)
MANTPGMLVAKASGARSIGHRSETSAPVSVKPGPVAAHVPPISAMFGHALGLSKVTELNQADQPQGTAHPGLLERLKQHSRRLNRDTYALYLVARHPRTPWYAKILAVAVVAYALSPFDLIPDFIPVIGYLDDLIIVPLGVAAVLRLVPAEVLAECREQAQMRMDRRVSWVGAAFIVAVWLVVVTWLVLVVRDLLT